MQKLIALTHASQIAVGDTLDIDGGLRATVTRTTGTRITVRRSDNGRNAFLSTGSAFVNRKPFMVITATDFLPISTRHGGSFLRNTAAYRAAQPHLQRARALLLDSEQSTVRDQRIKIRLRSAAATLSHAFTTMNRPVFDTIQMEVDAYMLESLGGGDTLDYFNFCMDFMKDMAPPPSKASGSYIVFDRQDNFIGILNEFPNAEAVLRTFGHKVTGGYATRLLMEDEVALY